MHHEPWPGLLDHGNAFFCSHRNRETGIQNVGSVYPRGESKVKDIIQDRASGHAQCKRNSKHLAKSIHQRWRWRARKTEGKNTFPRFATCARCCGGKLETYMYDFSPHMSSACAPSSMTMLTSLTGCNSMGGRHMRPSPASSCCSPPSLSTRSPSQRRQMFGEKPAE